MCIFMPDDGPRKVLKHAAALLMPSNTALCSTVIYLVILSHDVIGLTPLKVETQ
jgi:hypothetical protein